MSDLERLNRLSEGWRKDGPGEWTAWMECFTPTYAPDTPFNDPDADLDAHRTGYTFDYFARYVEQVNDTWITIAVSVTPRDLDLHRTDEVLADLLRCHFEVAQASIDDLRAEIERKVQR